MTNLPRSHSFLYKSNYNLLIIFEICINVTEHAFIFLVNLLIILYCSLQKRVKLPIAALNEHITCKLCHGYLVDAATITECLHTCKYDSFTVHVHD